MNQVKLFSKIIHRKKKRFLNKFEKTAIISLKQINITVIINKTNECIILKLLRDTLSKLNVQFFRDLSISYFSKSRAYQEK